MLENIFDNFKNTIDDVFTENPLMTLEKYKLNIPWISSANILQIHTKVAKQWEKYKNFRIQMCIVIIEEVQDGPIFIYNYDFNKDISLIKQENVAKTFIYVIDKDGHLIRVEKGSSECTIESSCNLSTSLQSIVFHLGIRGVDLLISGKTYSAQNYFKSYNDLLDSSRRLPICKYRVLLDQYYKKDVQFDPCEMLFARSIDIPKDKRQETIVKYNKLLRAQPENLLHKGLAKFLREYCSDTVINEYTNAVEDRYDIFVATEDDKVYIIELKWLGRSITSELNVFSKYNSPDRAIEGAYQLKKYVDRAEEYKEYLMEYPIDCAILLVYDVRETYTDIVFPELFSEYPNIDLSQIYRVDKKDISASSVYRHKKSAKRGIIFDG